MFYDAMLTRCDTVLYELLFTIRPLLAPLRMRYAMHSGTKSSPDGDEVLLRRSGGRYPGCRPAADAAANSPAAEKGGSDGAGHAEPRARSPRLESAARRESSPRLSASPDCRRTT